MAKIKLSIDEKIAKHLQAIKKLKNQKEEKSKEWYKSVIKEFKKYKKTDYSKLADYLIRNSQAIAEKLGFIEKTDKQ